MLRQILTRFVQIVIVLLAISAIAFLLIQTLGDPLGALLPPEATLQDREALIARLALDQPLITRFWSFVTGMLQGDFGLSYRTQTDVLTLIAERLPATVELGIASLVFTIVIGVPLGIYCGVRPDSWLSRMIMGGSLLGISLPNFVVGIVLIAVMSVSLGIFPAFGRGTTVQLGGWSTGFLSWSGLKSLVLPGLTLASFQITFIIRMLRTQLIEIGASEHIRFARARGLSETRIWFEYALRNTLLPVTTMLGLQLGNVIAFSVVTESVFAWPGIGTLFLQSVQTADVPVIGVYLILVGAIFMVINFCVEALYPLIDPRTRRRSA